MSCSHMWGNFKQHTPLCVYIRGHMYVLLCMRRPEVNVLSHSVPPCVHLVLALALVSRIIPSAGESLYLLFLSPGSWALCALSCSCRHVTQAQASILLCCHTPGPAVARNSLSLPPPSRHFLWVPSLYWYKNPKPPTLNSTHLML